MDLLALIRSYALRCPPTREIQQDLGRPEWISVGAFLSTWSKAMVVAVARRTFRRGDRLPRIRALHFFLPVIEEVLEVPCDPGYVQYLKGRLEVPASPGVLASITWRLPAQ